MMVDIRGLEPEHRREMVFSLVDKYIELGCADDIVIVCDHEPVGLGYQIDLRKESRGHFEFEYDKRNDGAWLAMIRPKSGPGSP